MERIDPDQIITWAVPEEGVGQNNVDP